MERRKRDRSPLNEAFGRFLSDTRRDRGWDEGYLAKHLCLSAVYFRTIELGTRSLPPKAAIGLAQVLALDIDKVSGLLVALDALDIRDKNNPAKYAFSEILALADRLRISNPRIAKLMEWAIATIGKISAKKPYDKSEVLKGAKILAEILFTPSENQNCEGNIPSLSRSDGTSSGSNAPRQRAKLAPVFEELIDILASNLSLYSPFMDVPSFEKWEKNQSNRIKEIRCYVEDEKQFLAEADHFYWGFLLNTHRPRLTMLVRPTSSMPPSEIEAQLKAILRSQLSLRDDGPLENLRVLPAAKPKECRSALLFDVAQRKMVPPSEGVSLTAHYLSTNRYLHFQNAWIYRLKPNTPGWVDDQDRLFGFLGSASSNDPSANYAGLMDAEHVEYCWLLFGESASSTSSKQANLR